MTFWMNVLMVMTLVGCGGISVSPDAPCDASQDAATNDAPPVIGERLPPDRFCRVDYCPRQPGNQEADYIEYAGSEAGWICYCRPGTVPADAGVADAAPSEFEGPTFPYDANGALLQILGAQHHPRMRLDSSNILLQIKWATKSMPLNVGHFRIHVNARNAGAIVKTGVPVWKTLTIYNGEHLVAGPYNASVVNDGSVEFYIVDNMFFPADSVMTLTYQIASCTRSNWETYAECPADQSTELLSSAPEIEVIGMEWGGSLFDANAITNALTNERLSVYRDLTVLGLHNNQPLDFPIQRTNQ